MTPFTIDLACAFSPSVLWAYGPWQFDTVAGELLFCGLPVEPCGWADMEALARTEPEEGPRWLSILREDVAARLAHRESVGSLWD